MSAGDLIDEAMPQITRALEEARDALSGLGDSLSDCFADMAADAGQVGHRTPRHVLAVYAAADETHRIIERLERWAR